MQYLLTAKRIYKENSKILLKYWWMFLGLAILYHVYEYLLFKFVGESSKYRSEIMSAYHVLIYPIIVLIIIYLVDCSNRRKLPTDLTKVMADTRRCYLRVLLIYLALDIARRYIGMGAGLIIFCVVYIKLPFLEQEIFFKNSGIWHAIKNNNELTNREDMLKSMTILIIIFCVVYLAIQKISRAVVASNIGHAQAILTCISMFEVAFFLFCKGVLTKTYTDIEEVK